MLTGSAANSFADDIMKWQKRLQTIEAVLSVWLEVQDKWIELEDVSIIRALQLRLTDWLTHGTHAKVKQCEKWQHTLEVTKVNKLGTIPISEISCTKFSLESRECLFPKFYLTAWKISKSHNRLRRISSNFDRQTFMIPPIGHLSFMTDINLVKIFFSR